MRKNFDVESQGKDTATCMGNIACTVITNDGGKLIDGGKYNS